MQMCIDLPLKIIQMEITRLQDEAAVYRKRIAIDDVRIRQMARQWAEGCQYWSRLRYLFVEKILREAIVDYRLEWVHHEWVVDMQTYDCHVWIWQHAASCLSAYSIVSAADFAYMNARNWQDASINCMLLNRCTCHDVCAWMTLLTIYRPIFPDSPYKVCIHTCSHRICSEHRIHCSFRMNHCFVSSKSDLFKWLCRQLCSGVL